MYGSKRQFFMDMPVHLWWSVNCCPAFTLYQGSASMKIECNAVALG
jgi:hypothetical protein